MPKEEKWITIRGAKVKIDEGQTKEEISKVYFDKPEQAEEHAELEIDGMISDLKENSNSPQLGAFFYVKSMVSGLCEYESERVYLSDEALRKMCKSFLGKPVVVGHIIGITTPEQIEEIKQGYVVESFYNEKDGWFWQKIMITDTEASQMINSGWKASTSYIPTDFGSAGKHNNVPYNQSIEDGTYTHLAIVQIPRYECAKIFTVEDFKIYNEDLDKKNKELLNSKKVKSGGLMLNFWKKQTVENPAEIDGLMVELSNGTSVLVSDVISTLEKKNEDDKKKEVDEKKKTDDMDRKYNVCGEEKSLKEILSTYETMKKDNADDEEESDEDKKKKEEEAKKKAEDEKKNEKTPEEIAADLAGKKDLKELKNNMSEHEKKNSVLDSKSTYETSADKIARGAEKY